jgi:hypothetical protein
MNQNQIYSGLQASADRLHTDERRPRWLIEQGHIRTGRIGRSHKASERIEEDIALMLITLLLPAGARHEFTKS